MCPTSYPEIFDKKIKKLRIVLSEKKISILAVLKYEEIYYLTGFYGKDSNSILIITPKKNYLLVNFIFHEEALLSTSRSSVEVILYKGNKVKKLAEIISSIKPETISVEGSKITHSDFLGLSRELKKINRKLKVQKNIIGQLRCIKDKDEIKSISKACSITDSAFKEITSYSAKRISGMNELELANELEDLCIKNGGYGRSFDFVTASGPDSSKPHYLPSHKKISGGMLLLDFGTIYNHYFSDITRTVFLKKSSAKKRLIGIYKIVLEAQMEALESCKEGVRCDQLDSTARKVIEKAGFGEKYGHGLGHGVGLEVHEGPYITRRNKEVLKENMVITIEPGIYIPGLGGVRIEDMVVVGKNGCRNLYQSKKDFTFLS